MQLWNTFRIERPDGTIDIKTLQYYHTEKSMEEFLRLVSKEYELYRLNITRVFFLPEDAIEVSSETSLFYI